MRTIPVARDLMVRRLVTLSPDQPVIDAIRVLVRKDISGAPVVDGEGRLLGLCSEHDCLKALATSEYHADGGEYAVKVGDLMTEMAHTIPPDLDLYAVAGRFVTLRVRRLPVLEDGRLVGQVSRRDVLRAVLRLHDRATA